MCRKGGGGGGGNCYCCVSSCLSSALGVVIVVKLNLKASLLKSAAQPNPIAFLIGFRNENMNSCELSSCEQVVKHDVRPTPTPTPSRESRDVQISGWHFNLWIGQLQIHFHVFNGPQKLTDTAHTTRNIVLH